MLEIFNNMQPFLEDTYREVGVREFARMQNISAPTASTILKRLAKEGIVHCRQFRNCLLFKANRANVLFQDLSLTYWKQKLRVKLKELHVKLNQPKIVLFGSISKTEHTKHSDIDLYIEKPSSSVDATTIETLFDRQVQCWFTNAKKHRNLWKNIRRGVDIY